ncbi:MAG: hypothetical protein ACRCX2_30455 [Paraclostridium sp.]
MKLYSFVYERDSYLYDNERRQTLYQSFNKKSLELTRGKLIRLKNLYEYKDVEIGAIFCVEIDLENEVWQI